MTSANVPSLNFPDPSQFSRVEAVAIYLAPIAFSDEKLCIGLAARQGTALKVVPVPGFRRLKCSYGRAFRAMELAARLSLESLDAHLSRGPLTAEHLNAWIRPDAGVSVGEVRITSARSLDQAVDGLLRELSSLYTTDAPIEEEEREERVAAVSSARLERLVKEQVLELKPDYVSRFDRRFQVSDGARALRLGYSGERIVLNFSLLWTTQLAGAVRTSKAKLWDLAQARDGASSGWFGMFSPTAFELLVHHASGSDVAVTERGLQNVREALSELEAEADKHDLRCRPILTPEAIAKYLVEAETAPA